MINERKNHFSTNSSVLALAVATVALSFSGIAEDAIGSPASETVRIQANIPTMCQFDESFGQINIENLINGKPAGSNSAAQATAVVTCNESADVELESTRGGMVHFGVHIAQVPAMQEAPLGGDYLTRFDYTATLTDQGGGLDFISLETAGATGPVSAQASLNAMPSAQELTLEIEPEHVTGVLQAGEYRDDLVVRIIPQE
jgi:hypothetical protein